MICTRCGSNNPDGVKFCSTCGSPLNQPPQPANNGFNQMPPQPANNGFNQPPQPADNGFNRPPQPQNNGFNQMPPNNGFNQMPPQFGMNQMQRPKNNTGLIAGAAGAIAAVIAVVLIVIFASGGSQQKTADKFAKGVNKGNMEMVVESMLPKKAIKKIESLSGQSLDSIADSYGGMGDLEDISDCKIKVKGKYDVDESEISSFKQSMAFMDIKVSKVEGREIEISYKEDGEKETDTEEAIFYKAGGKWYIIPSM